MKMPPKLKIIILYLQDLIEEAKLQNEIGKQLAEHFGVDKSNEIQNGELELEEILNDSKENDKHYVIKDGVKMHKQQ